MLLILVKKNGFRLAIFVIFTCKEKTNTKEALRARIKKNRSSSFEKKKEMF